MTIIRSGHKLILGLLLLGAAAGACAQSESAAIEAGGWHTTLRAYGWLPKIDSTLSFPRGGGGTYQLDQGKILDSLNFTFMGSALVRKGRWSVMTDLIYMDLRSDANQYVNVRGGPGFNAEVDTKLNSWIWTLAGGYTAWSNERANLDVLLGFRMLDMTSKNKLRLTGPRSDSFTPRLDTALTNWDAIIGVRGRYGIDDRWFLPYYADIGTGDTSLTTNLQTGIGNGFDWGEVTLTYRWLYYDQGSDQTLEELSIYGPALGVNLSF